MFEIGESREIVNARSVCERSKEWRQGTRRLFVCFKFGIPFQNFDVEEAVTPFNIDVDVDYWVW